MTHEHSETRPQGPGAPAPGGRPEDPGGRVGAPADRGGRDGAQVLADAFVDRALGRAAVALGIGSLALAVLSLLFLVLAGGDGAASWAPQAVVLGLAQVAGLAVAVRCTLLLRSLRKATDIGRVGQGRALAAEAARWLGGLVAVLPVLTGGAVVVLALTVRPLPATLLSSAVALALVAQLLLLAVVQRAALRRAAAGPW